MTELCEVDDKFVPLYRIVWVASVPHFCGSDECQREGQYEIRLEQGEAVWATTIEQRDAVVEALRRWGESDEWVDDDEE
jgi:hypothetical protein